MLPIISGQRRKTLDLQYIRQTISPHTRPSMSWRQASTEIVSITNRKLQTSRPSMNLDQRTNENFPKIMGSILIVQRGQIVPIERRNS